MYGRSIGDFDRSGSESGGRTLQSRRRKRRELHRGSILVDERGLWRHRWTPCLLLTHQSMRPCASRDAQASNAGGNDRGGKR